MKKFILLIAVACMFIMSVPCYAYGNLYVNYDADDAVQYAESYAFNYNSAYPSYDNDNANFVSQCLVAGGMVQTSGWHCYRTYFLGIPIGWDKTTSWTSPLSLASYVSDNFAYHDKDKNSDLGYVSDYRQTGYHYLNYIHAGDVMLYLYTPTNEYHVALVTESIWLYGTNVTQHAFHRETGAKTYQKDRLNDSFRYEYSMSYSDAAATRLWQHAMTDFS